MRLVLYHSICCSNNNHMRSELYRGHAGQVQIPVEHIMSPEQRCHCCQTEKRAEWNGLFSPLDFKEKEYDGDESSADRCQPDSNEDIWKSRNIRPIMPASLISPPPIPPLNISATISKNRKPITPPSSAEAIAGMIMPLVSAVKIESMLIAAEIAMASSIPVYTILSGSIPCSRSVTINTTKMQPNAIAIAAFQLGP